MKSLAIVMVLAAVVVLISWLCSRRWPTNNALTAWVQATGSIAAIIGAFLIADQQSADSRAAVVKAQANDEIRRLEIILATLNQLLGHLVKVSDVLDESGSDEYAASRVKALLTSDAVAVASLPLMEFPEANLAATVMTIPSEIHLILSRMDDAIKKENRSPADQQRKLKDQQLRVIGVIDISTRGMKSASEQITLRRKVSQ